MNAAADRAAAPKPRRRRRRLLGWLVAAPLLLSLIAWLALRIALPPERVTRIVLDRLGAALNLEIEAEGDALLLFGTHPTFAVRNVVAREPGAATPLLQARRVQVSLPWRTIRGLGDVLDLVRIDLDAPVLDLPALQRWLATRPPGDARLPTLSDGLRVRDGRIVGDGWQVAALALTIPRLDPAHPLRAEIAGRYRDTTLQAPFDLVATLSHLTSGADLGVDGRVVLAHGGDWSLPAWIALSGPLSWDDGLRMQPLRLGTSARFRSGGTDLPFALGLHGPFAMRDGVSTLAPAGIVLRGDGVVPRFDARGTLALGARLVLRAHGAIAEWPDAWPALPPPLGQSTSPLALAFDYAGRGDLSDPLHLQVTRDDTRFDGRLRVPEIAAWAVADAAGSPLPPLRGRLETPRIEVSGAQVEGVVVEFDDGRATGDADP